jgi:hypothetical protein
MTDNKKPPSDRNNLITFHPHHLFLYGTLTDPMQLQKCFASRTHQLFNPPVSPVGR